jgi:hypothetical protein
MSVELKGKQVEALRDALVQAFPTYKQLTALMRFELDENIAAHVAPGPMNEVALELVEWAQAEGRLDDLLAGARAQRPRNAALQSLLLELSLTSAPPPAGRLEALVVASVPFEDVAKWRARMAAVERAICLVEDPTGTGAGTGFLVGPRTVLTNWHVMAEVERRGFPPQDARLRFDYVAAVDGAAPSEPSRWPLATDWRIDGSEVAALDFALVRVEGAPGSEPVPAAGGQPRGWLAPAPHEFELNEIQLILQHPRAAELKLGAGVVTAVDPLHHRVTYTTNTLPGSSGAPVFTLGWELVALHHFGQVTGNMGIPLAAIWDQLRANLTLAQLGGAA